MLAADCDFTDATLTHDYDYEAVVTVPLTTAGTFHYACKLEGHCQCVREPPWLAATPRQRIGSSVRQSTLLHELKQHLLGRRYGGMNVEVDVSSCGGAVVLPNSPTCFPSVL